LYFNFYLLIYPCRISNYIIMDIFLNLCRNYVEKFTHRIFIEKMLSKMILKLISQNNLTQ